MHNRTKSSILRFLDILPKKIGYTIYHMLQMITLKDVDFYVKTNESSFYQIHKILNENNIDVKNENIIEIGSGWFPIMPLIFKEKLVVNTIYTYDINKHYSKRRILNSTALFSKRLNISGSKQLPSFIKYYPHTSIQTATIDYNAKLVYSRFVLEHISHKELLEIHQYLYKNTPDTIKILHLISPSDHRSYSDASISTYDFLKYSETAWNKIQTKFDYHNRLRLPDYIKIIKESGFTVEYLNYDKVDKTSKKYKMFKDLTLHPSYDTYTEEEILAGSINLLLSK